MDTKTAEKVADASKRFNITMDEVNKMIIDPYTRWNSIESENPMKNRAALHKKAVERRKKAKRGGKR